MTFKVLGGTLLDEHKCANCERGQSMTTANGGEFVYCRAIQEKITRRVVKCSAYRLVGQNWQDNALSEQAYLIDKDGNGNVVFHDPTGKKITFKKGVRVGRKKARQRVAIDDALKGEE